MGLTRFTENIQVSACPHSRHQIQVQEPHKEGGFILISSRAHSKQFSELGFDFSLTGKSVRIEKHDFSKRR
jgi:hypothetical protein